MIVMATSSPGPRTQGEKDLATRFRLSLVLRVKTTSARVGRADEGGDLRADVSDGRGGRHGETVEAAQRVGVHGLVEAALGVEGAGGALRGGRAVEKRDLGVGGSSGKSARYGF